MENFRPESIAHLKKSLADLSLQSADFGSFLKSAHKPLGQCICDYVTFSRTAYEQEKHADVDKYLYQPFFEYAKNPGKLHRPALCIASFLMNGGKIDDVEKVLPVACAIEVFQAAALIHDDIADNATLRRNEPCFHIKHGEEIGINAGDYGLSAVLGITLKQLMGAGTSHEEIVKILDELCAMEIMTIEGQAIDLGWARDQRYDITEDDYFTMARKKTAYYSCAAPCVLGAICAGADAARTEALRNFGLKAGLAFQIQDDILNLTSPGDKDFMSDITEGKRTLLVVHTLAGGDNCGELQKILTSGTTDDCELKHAVKIIEDTGTFAYANNIVINLVEDAKNYLTTNYNNQWCQIVLSMADWAITRSK